MPSPVLYLEIFIIRAFSQGFVVLPQDSFVSGLHSFKQSFSLISVLDKSSDGTLQFWYMKRSVLCSLLQILKKHLADETCTHLVQFTLVCDVYSPFPKIL